MLDMKNKNKKELNELHSQVTLWIAVVLANTVLYIILYNALMSFWGYK